MLLPWSMTFGQMKVWADNSSTKQSGMSTAGFLLPLLKSQTAISCCIPQCNCVLTTQPSRMHLHQCVMCMRTRLVLV